MSIISQLDSAARQYRASRAADELRREFKGLRERAMSGGAGGALFKNLEDIHVCIASSSLHEHCYTCSVSRSIIRVSSPVQYISLECSSSSAHSGA